MSGKRKARFNPVSNRFSFCQSATPPTDNPYGAYQYSSPEGSQFFGKFSGQVFLCDPEEFTTVPTATTYLAEQEQTFKSQFKQVVIFPRQRPVPRGADILKIGFDLVQRFQLIAAFNVVLPLSKK